MFIPHTPFETSTSNDIPLKTPLAFIHGSIFRASHVHMLGGSDSLPDLQQRLARQRVGGRVGNDSIVPLYRIRLNTLSAQERCTGQMLWTPVVPLHLSCCSPPHRPSRCMQYIDRHVLQTLALPLRVMAFTRRTSSESRSNSQACARFGCHVQRFSPGALC